MSIPERLSRTASASDNASLTDRAYRELEEMIVTLKLIPGAVLSEGLLAQTLDIGRTPIREALQRLAMEGLVVIYPRRGVLVSDINVKSQLELLKVRREIEGLMTRLATERATPIERERFREIAAAMRLSAQRNDDAEFLRLDQQFNQLLEVACQNDFAKRAMGLMMGLCRRFWYMHYKQALDLLKSANLHADMSEAIAKGDASFAEKACHIHLDYVETFTRQSLDLSPNR